MCPWCWYIEMEDADTRTHWRYLCGNCGCLLSVPKVEGEENPENEPILELAQACLERLVDIEEILSKIIAVYEG